MSRATSKTIGCSFVIALLALSGAPTVAFSNEVRPPRLREQIVLSARSLAEQRKVFPSLPDRMRNPFVATEEASQIEDMQAPPGDDVGPQKMEPAEAPLELLARIAASIPATGAVRLGGRPLLLLGQNRYRIGDMVPVEFEGRSYEVKLVEITLVAFTVQMGDLAHTRPIRLSSSP